MSAYHRPLDENDLTLVERVKMTPSLYDPRNPDFRFAHRKSQDWEKLASNLGLSSTDAKRRWRTLRDRYARELKAMREHPERKGYGEDEFFRVMDFLRCFVRKRDRRRNVTVKNDEAYLETGSNDASNKVFSSKLLDDHCAQNDEKDEHEAHINLNEPANEETGDDFFCKSIAAYLRQLSRRHKINAKVEMFQILEKYIEIEENELAEKAHE